MHIVLFLLILACASAQAPGFWLYGVPNSNIGTSVGTVTDLDGDGNADMFVGGPTTGETYLVLLNLTGVTSLNLTAFNGGNRTFSLPGQGVILQGDGDTGNSIASAGDFNGDGYNDIIIGAPRSSPFNVTFAGSAYLIFGRDPTTNAFPNVIDLRTLNGVDGFQICGHENGEEAGTVGGIDDINGDGFDDIIIGAPLGSPNGDNSGRVYVIYGFPGPFPEVFNLSSLNGSNGFVINGMSPGEQAGYAVSRAGDVNADGSPDFLIAAPFAVVNGTPFCGRVYLLYGNRTALNVSVIELFDLPNTTMGTTLNGGAGDYVGFGGVAPIGDFNADGTDDFIIGAPHSGPSGAGQAFVVFGRRWDSIKPFNHTVNLRNLRGTNGFALIGTVVGGTAGFVGPAGDITGDGIPDLIVGAPLVSPQGVSRAGQSYVLYGRRDAGNPFPASIKLTSLPVNGGLTINGVDANSQSGFSVTTLGDVNSDGYSDILIGAPSVAPSSGEAFVVFGRNATANPYKSPFNLNLLNACWGSPAELGSNFIVNQSCIPPIPAGRSCNLSCAAGYVAIGNLSAVCSADGTGRYVPVPGTCQAATCRGLSLSVGINTATTSASCFDGTATTGTECIFSCMDGYSRSGMSVCTGQGYNSSVWVSNQTCIAANCSSLVVPTGANSTSLNRKCVTTDRQTGATCPFTCLNGYTHNGGITTCVGSGPGVSNWVTNQSCIPTNCAGITLPVGAINADPICTNGQAKTGDACRFSCANGYNWTGSTICVGVTANTSAFTSTQNCIPASCPALVIPAGVNQSTISSKCLARNSYPGDTCTFSCSYGYTESGRSVCEGVSPGVSGWTTNQTCVAAQCPQFQFPPGADLTSTLGCTNATTGKPCLFSCQPGWIHSGISTCVGVAHGLSNWVTNQTCTRATCAGLTLPIGSILNSANCVDGSARTGDVCEFSCDIGFHHTGMTVCDASGINSSTFFTNQTCIPAGCGVFRLPAGVDTTTVQPSCTNGLASTGDSCSFGCRAGYAHSGITTCVGTGPDRSQWISNQTCESAFCAPVTIPTGATHVRGHCTDGQAVIGDTCTFDCLTGYVHSGITVCASTGPLTAAFFNTQLCQDFNACTVTTTPCGQNSDCIDLPPPSLNYTCQCRYGYTASNGLCIDIPACGYFPCGPNEDCLEIEGGDNATTGRICQCAEGYTRSNVTDLCEDIPACANYPCDIHATCTEILGGPNSDAGRKCECIKNYYGNGEAGYCFVIETCDDKIQDNGETDVDCGGIRCSPCDLGQKCVSGSDCISRSCAGICTAASSSGLTWLSQVLLILIAVIVFVFLLFLFLRYLYIKGKFPCLRRTIVFNEEMELHQIEGDPGALGQAAAAEPIMAEPVPPANVEEAQFLNQANVEQQNVEQNPPEELIPEETTPPDSVAVLFHESASALSRAVSEDDRGEKEVVELEPGEAPGSQS